MEKHRLRVVGEAAGHTVPAKDHLQSTNSRSMNTFRQGHLPLTALFFLCVLLIGSAVLVAGCGKPPASGPTYDSAHGIALDARIEKGHIVTAAPPEDPDAVLEDIKRQLFYSIGQFNGEGGVGELSDVKIDLGGHEQLSDGTRRVEYTASFLVSWPRAASQEHEYGLILPIAVSGTPFDQFYQVFSLAENKCLDASAHDLSAGNLWYYYRPQTCPAVVAANASLLAKFPVTFRISGVNTAGKFPEYDMIWSDGKLAATLIFGKNKLDATADSDAGIAAYNAMYKQLTESFGQPASSNLPAGILRPGNAHPALRLTFQHQGRELDLAIYLIASIQSADEAFISEYNTRTQFSDYVSYNAHSGLGANIQALARLGKFTTGQYQIFLINGCDTFAYLDKALQDAHHAANPGHAPTKFFDFITNAMPAYFHTLAASNMAMLQGFINQDRTYAELLSQFDPKQMAAVVGEEDNLFVPPPIQQVE